MGSSPIFPSINQICQYSYFSNQYNLLVSKKHRYKNLRFTKTTKNIAQVLHRAGAISNFTIFNSPINHQTYLKITIFFYKNSPFFKKIKLVSSPSKKFYITTHSLILLQKIFKSSILILSTSKGLLTGTEALSIGVGGSIIYVVI